MKSTIGVLSLSLEDDDGPVHPDNKPLPPDIEPCVPYVAPSLGILFPFVATVSLCGNEPCSLGDENPPLVFLTAGFDEVYRGLPQALLLSCVLLLISV